MNRLPVVSFCLVLSSCVREAPQRVETQATPVHTTLVEAFAPRSGERYSASISPRSQVNVAFRVGGYVESLCQVRGSGGGLRSLEPGDIVEKDTVLARLRQQDYDLQLSQASAELEAARSNLAAARAQLAQAEAGAGKARADFDRARVLFESQSLTKPDYDAASAQADASRAQVAAVQAQIEAASARVKTAEAVVGTAKLARQDITITAPFTAAVVQRQVEIGALAAAGSPAYSLANLDEVKATFGVPDLVAVDLRPGRTLAFSIESLPASEFRGTVSAVAAVADPATRLFQVEAVLPNARRTLRPGMIASVNLGGRAPAPMPVVPLSAVVRGRAADAPFSVMVVQAERARLRNVTLGPTYGDRLAVTSGLKPGETVISSGATLVSDGDRVEVIP